MNKKWLYPVGLILAVLIAFYVYSRYHVAPAIDLRQLNLVDLEGAPVKLETYKGKKVVLCFSASWCGNCREELETIRQVKASELSDVEVVVVSDESLEKVRAFKEKKDYPFIFLKMEQPFNTIGIHSIPTSYIINTNFEIKKETVGYINWKDPSTMQHLKKLME